MLLQDSTVVHVVDNLTLMSDGKFPCGDVVQQDPFW